MACPVQPARNHYFDIIVQRIMELRKLEHGPYLIEHEHKYDQCKLSADAKSWESSSELKLNAIHGIHQSQ
jgi:hypothetical protein